jgi:hypothetical protein
MREFGRTRNAAGRSSRRPGVVLVSRLRFSRHLAVLAGFRKGAEPAGLAVGFALYLVGPLLGGLTMLAKGRSVRAGLLVAALFPLLGHVALLGLANHRG